METENQSGINNYKRKSWKFPKKGSKLKIEEEEEEEAVDDGKSCDEGESTLQKIKDLKY